ncbi:MAG: hypothetical protein DRP64_05905 [Verrucomicrobia bacterium]|nr:MAG: hypothetical protein DRP64_05905 [Verrucomicrobiota bacterium]
MKKKQGKIQYTIRAVPTMVNEAVRAYSVREGCSLNQAVLDALRKGAGASDRPVIHHDLDFMAGSWVADEKCDQALAEFDRIDEGMWK